MKNTLLICLMIFTSIGMNAQQENALKVISYKLDNGFTVFLNQDKTASRVYGAVMVNAGAKHEDPEATGMAHYLEHLLFKGTDILGTKDFEKEKPFLDSINVLYEALANAETDEMKLSIQKKINDQALKASEYGLPNEFNKLLKSIGSTGINAFTNYEMTFYHNSFPPHEIRKWLDLYATRFRNPVFRSFQSELEVVYEEKNRAMDNFERKVSERLYKHLFEGQPYGEWPLLGTVQHLKNPSLIKMYDFYDKYYVSDNMALILSGNFDPQTVRPMIDEIFKDFRTGTVSQPDIAPLPAFDGVEKHKARITPVKAGFVSYRTVPSLHPDRAALDVYEYILSNNSGTGLVDQLMKNNELIYSGKLSAEYNDAGGLSLFYVPKVLIQSLRSGEKKILNIISDINSGEIDEELFKIAKNELQISFEKGLANLTTRGRMIGQAFNLGQAWEEYIQYPEMIEEVTKADLMRVGKQYFGKNRMRFISRTGFPRKNKLKKPPYKPLITDQKGTSKYAAGFNQIESLPFEPKFIDFENAIERKDITGGHRLLASQNTVNDLFNLTIRFKKGTLHDTRIPLIAGFLSNSGAGSYDRIALNKAFAVKGLDYNVWADGSHLMFNIAGKERSIAEGLRLLNLLMTEPKLTEKSKKSYVNQLYADRKVERNDPVFMRGAVFNYALYGDRSALMTRKPVSEIKQTDLDQISQEAKAITENYSADIIYYGTKSLNEIASMLDQYLTLTKEPKAEAYIYPAASQAEKNKIYLVADKKAVQSNIYFYISGEEFDQEDFAVANAFNQYFGGGFTGLMLQEIREYRSLAYSTAARYNEPLVPGRKGRLYALMGCQSDKTNDAISVMMDLLQDMPRYDDRMDALRKNMQLRVVTDFPQPSEMVYEIMDMERKGYESDPNRKAFDQYENLTMDQIMDFYERNIKGRPVTITIYGDDRNFDVDELRKIGEVIELDKTDVAKF